MDRNTDHHAGMSYELWRCTYGATPYPDWCQHYGYDPTSGLARADYGRYLDELATLTQLADCGAYRK